MVCKQRALYFRSHHVLYSVIKKYEHIMYFILKKVTLTPCTLIFDIKAYSHHVPYFDI